MANLQDHTVTGAGAQNITQCPRLLIAGRFEEVNPATGRNETIYDATGANALDFPTCLKTFTPEQIELMVRKWAPDILAIKAGLFTP
jgi:hypothetical protein